MRADECGVVMDKSSDKPLRNAVLCMQCACDSDCAREGSAGSLSDALATRIVTLVMLATYCQ